MIDESVSMELLARLFSSQLVTKAEKHLLDRSRTYFKLLRRIVSEGQERGEITKAYSTDRIVKAYTMFERALLYDWCLYEGEYSLPVYGDEMMPLMLQGYRAENNN